MAGATVVIVETILIVGLPLPERNYQNAEGYFIRPETVFHSRPHQEFLMGFRANNLAIHFQPAAVVDKMKQFVADLSIRPANPGDVG